MKKIYLVLLICFIANTSIAQSLGFSYQAVIVNPNTQNLPGNDIEDGLLSETDILIRFTIENNTSVEYQETHATITDIYGMLNLMVGQGQANIGNFSEIVWGGDEKFLKVEIDFSSSGSTYENLDRQIMTYLPQPISNETMAILDQIKSDISNNTATIDSEASRAKAAEQENMNAIALEAARANSAEQDNSNKIGVLQIISNSNTIAIATEQARATAAEQANANAISTNASDISTANTNISTNASAITGEEIRATAAEQANANAISTNALDISTANTNISTNTSAITTEENRAIVAEQANANAIITNASDISVANTNISTNASAITTEEIRATAAEQANANAISSNATDIATNTANITNLANSGSGPIFHQSTSSGQEITYSTSYVDMSLIVTTSPTNSGTSNCLISFSGTLSVPNYNGYTANAGFLINIDGVDIVASERGSESPGYRSVSTIYYATNVPDGAVIKVRQFNAQGAQNWWSKPTLIVQQYPN